VAGKFAEVANQVRLVEVAGVGGYVGPGMGALRGQIAGATKTKDAAEMFGRQTALIETTAAKLSRAHAGLRGDPIQID
jgi:hypothetical protein